VGLCIDRSLAMVVAMLGIMKAGGAYVPLDPAYPKERLAFMVEDSGLSIVVTEEKLVTEMRDLTTSSTKNIVLVDLDNDWEKISPQSSEKGASQICKDSCRGEAFGRQIMI